MDVSSLANNEPGSFGNVEIIVSWRRRAVLGCVLVSNGEPRDARINTIRTLSLFTVGSILPSLAVITVILRITLAIAGQDIRTMARMTSVGMYIPMVRATRTIPVTTAAFAIIVAIAVPALILAR
jgi:hypothetical protein